MQYLRLSLYILVFLLLGKVYAIENSETNALSSSSAVKVALRDNPGLAEMQSRYQALLSVPDQKASLPDPILSIGTMNFPTDTFERRQEAMTQVQIGISQYFPFPGKLSLRKEAAEFEAKAALFSVDEMRLKLVNYVEHKWWQLYYLDRALETISINKSLLHQFIEVAKTKYETGKGLQQDVLLAQLELSKLIDQELMVASLRDNQEIRLNVLMNRLPLTPIKLPQTVSKSLPSLKAVNDLYRLAENSRPLLKSKEQFVSAAKSRLDLAKRDYYPDFNVTAAYSDRRGNNPPFQGGERADLFSFALGIKIPLYASSKQTKALHQRTSEHEQQRYGLQDEKNQVKADISSALIDYQRAGEQLSLLDSGIVPQAKQTVQSMLSGYQVSEVDFLNLVRSQITLFNYELQYWKTLTEAKQALSLLNAVVGEEAIDE